jgi:Tol biopolymer transport system component
VQLDAGSRLGTYEIIGLLGAGGMGEVYRATDTKLNRQVAIKVLPEVYASDPDRVARFHREAQAVAALNHTNIAAIYDLAESGATKFLVLELIEGDTLADRIRRGPVPVEEALAIVKQILEALEVAHEKGICHRDLKPANVKLTPDGAVKVLDFGLAKFLQSSPSVAHMSHSPTLSVAGTYPGVILGTAGYMSPEQAKGYEADHRSDLFSVGCILYELLTGRQAFEGETASEILAGVLKSEADFTLLPPRLNPRLVELLRRCLEKNPKKRWHAAADVRVEIESLMGRAVIADEPRMAVTAPRPLWRRALPAVAGVLLGGLAAAYAAWTLKPDPPRPVTRFTVSLPETSQFTNTGRLLVALSPDGANLVYVADQRLFLRPLSGLEPRVIPGSETPVGILNPVFSPDGQSLAFWSAADVTLKRIAVTGGAPVTICAALGVYGMSWSDDGIVFGQAGKGILRVSPNGGTPDLIAGVEADELASMPSTLPGGKAVLFSVKKQADTWDAGRIVVQAIGGARKTVLEGGADARYLPTGHLVYAVSGMLMAVPFDLATLSVVGAAVPVIEGVRRAGIMAGATGTAQFAYSATGAIAYVPGPAIVNATGERDLALFDLNGVPRPLKLKPGSYTSPRVSPDGKFVAVGLDDERDANVWIYELSGRAAMQRLTAGGKNRFPIWTADSRSVTFQSDRDGDVAVFQQRADGSGTVERLTRAESGVAHAPQSWSPDGEHMLYSAQQGAGATLWVWSRKDRKATPFAGVKSVENAEAAFSRDGRWVAYQTRDAPTSPRQIFLEPFPPTGSKYFVREGGHPYWTGKGDALIINSGPGVSDLVPVGTAPRVVFGEATRLQRLTRSEPNPGTARRNVDAMPGTDDLLGVLVGGAAQASGLANEIVVVLNWFDEVRPRAPRK